VNPGLNPGFGVLSPHLRTPNPGFNSGFNPLFNKTSAGGEPRVKPGVRRPEMWAQHNGRSLLRMRSVQYSACRDVVSALSLLYLWNILLGLHRGEDGG
jgi:hypothetical protein